MRVYKQRDYTMSIRAHTKLQHLLASPIVSRATRNRRTDIPMYDGMQVRRIQDTTQPKLEGISNSLNVLANNYDLGEWQDTRPDYIRTQHSKEYEMAILAAHAKALFASIAEYKHHLNDLYQSPPSYRAKWYKAFDQEYQRYIDSLTYEEIEQFTEREHDEYISHQQDRRRSFKLCLSDYAREYYYGMALIWGMDTLALRTRGETAYIAASLEAIGTEYITPPDGYEVTLQENPNLAKARERDYDNPNHKGKLYGNFAHTPYMAPKPPSGGIPFNTPSKVTQEHIDWLCYMGAKDVAQQIVEQNTKLAIKS